MGNHHISCPYNVCDDDNRNTDHSSCRPKSPALASVAFDVEGTRPKPLLPFVVQAQPEPMNVRAARKMLLDCIGFFVGQERGEGGEDIPKVMRIIEKYVNTKIAAQSREPDYKAAVRDLAYALEKIELKLNRAANGSAMQAISGCAQEAARAKRATSRHAPAIAAARSGT